VLLQFQELLLPQDARVLVEKPGHGHGRQGRKLQILLGSLGRVDRHRPVKWLLLVGSWADFLQLLFLQGEGFRLVVRFARGSLARSLADRSGEDGKNLVIGPCFLLS